MSQTRTRWLIYAIASGGCAALNGVFAKLTTTHLTTSWAAWISEFVGVKKSSAIIEYLVRVSFFLMNLAFNGVMWGLFTRALTLSSSTVRVSVINTSANFVVTAFLGAIVFSENLPALWWAGAGLLVAGSIIIGRRDEGKGSGSSESVDEKLAVTSKSRAASNAVSGASSGFSGNREATTTSERKRT